MIEHKRKYWTEAEISFLKINFGKITFPEIAIALGRSRNSVKCKADKLGLKLPEEIRKAIIESTRFKKGQTPWNKGIYYRCSIRTEFKKGQKPKNTKTLYSVSLRKKRLKDGGVQKYLFIKLADNKWELLHRYLWRQYNGDIPPGMLVVFKDHNSLNCVIENLELIDKAENCKRNSKDHPAVRLNDGFIVARCFGLSGKYNDEKYRFIKENPELIELKRKQLLLNRVIRKVE
jgi:hypothetical protein